MNRLAIIVFLIGIAVANVGEANAQPVTTLYSFTKGPANPRASLTAGPDGAFYGTTEFGGAAGQGTVFRTTTNGVTTTLVNFSGYGNGSWPVAGLTLGADGNFYGTASGGGTNLTGTNATGTVFRMTTNGTVTVLVNFNGGNGGSPQAGLALGPDGNFYGTTEFGGSNNDGTVFQMTTNGTLTTLVTFNGTNGANPIANLTAGPGGTLYGTTEYGGTNGGYGTVYAVTTNGVFRSVLEFGGTNGAWPYGGVTVGPDGNLYGTTAFGGNPNGSLAGGSIFELTTNGTLTTLVRLADLGGSNGVTPYGGLTLGTDGNFYGTTYAGGAYTNGTVFQVSTNGTLALLARIPGIQVQTVFNSFGIEFYTTNNWTTLAEVFNGTLTTLASFPAQTNSINAEGAKPEAGLTLGADGRFYGTTYTGGTNGFGTAFKITTNGTFTTLASLSGNNGLNPESALTAGPRGILYGTTFDGGTGNYGTVFQLTTGGTLTTLASFDDLTTGANPQAALIPGPGGNLYGTASGGGSNLLYIGNNTSDAVSDGTVFAISTNGVLTALADFNGTNGANPYGGLTMGLDGNFYGTTTYGGISNDGTIFQLLTNGTLTTLTSFTGADGANPYAGLTLGTDGNFYGTTEAGGATGEGTVFQVTSAGALTTLASFNGANGANPNAGLISGPDGSFYGTTWGGGADGEGTVFKITAGGTLTTLVSFAQTNGEYPVAGLALGPDGNFYGTTELGGPDIYGGGTVFEVTSNGTLTTLYSFDSTNGNYPFAGLTLATNSDFIHFYGTTYGGGGGGSVFQLNLTTSYAVAENSTSMFQPLTNEVVWSTGGTLGLVSVGTTNGTAEVSGSDIVFTPATNFTGTATISYTVTDNAGGTNYSELTVLVTNVPPVANPDFYTVAENSGANVLNPLANDAVGTRGGVLSLVSVSATNGTAAISGTNVLFTPATNFAGTATIGYTITDNVGGTNSSLITVDVTLAPPVANPQTVTTAENTAQIITLTATEPNPLPLTYSIVTGPANGTLSGLNPSTGVVTYTPATNYSGPDSFTFAVNNGQSGSAPATVGITVTATVVTNTPPVANPDFYSVAENSTNIFNPLANDTAGTAGGTLGLASVSATNGTAFISGTNVVFTPSTNFLGTAIIGYTITDNVGGSASSLITVTVTNFISVAITAPTAGEVVSNAAFTVTGTASAGTTATVAEVYVQLNGGVPVGAVTTNGWTNWTAAVTLTPGTNTVSAYAVDGQGAPSPTNTVLFEYATNPPALADVSLTVTAAPNPVDLDVSSLVTYIITVSNAGPATATDVTVSNADFAAGSGLAFGAATGGATPTNGLLLLNLGALAAGATNTATITAYVGREGSSTNRSFTNLFAVMADQIDPQPANNLATVALEITNANATLATTSTRTLETNLTAGTSRQATNYSTQIIAKMPDGTVVYNQTIAAPFTNGAIQAAVAQAAAALTNAGAASYTGPVETSYQQTLQGSSSVTVTNAAGTNVTTMTTAYAGPQTIFVGTNQTEALTLYAGETDYDTLTTYDVTNLVTTTTTNTYLSSAVYTLTGVAAAADLSVTASIGSQTAVAGQPLVYTVTVSNAGPQTATSVILSNAIPAGEVFSSVTGGSTPTNGVLLVNLGSLAAGTATNITLIVYPTLPPGQASGTLQNDFYVSGSQPDPQSANNFFALYTPVGAAPVDIGVSLAAAPDPVDVGAPLTYSVTVTNNSGATAAGVVVSNILPPNVTLYSLLPSQGTASNNAGTVTFTVGTLPGGGAATLAIVVLPQTAGQLTNTAEAFSAETDAQPADNFATNVTTALSVPITNLVLTVLSGITLNPQTGLFEERIQVSNGGPTTPSSVLVLISGLAANVKVYDATGTTNGLPYVQSSAPLGIGSNVTFLVEYYVPTRVAPTNLTLTVQAGPAVIPPVVTGTILSISGMTNLPNGDVLVDFHAVPGQVYAIQYSSDLQTWLTAVPAITAPANQVQWIDSGPPKTVSSPAQAGTRYYRVVLLTGPQPQ